MDGDLKICGADVGYEQYKNLYLTDLSQTLSGEIKHIFDSGVCVKSCPTDVAVDIDCMPTTEVPNCNSDHVKTYKYKTRAIAGYCFPHDLNELPEAYKQGW